MFGRIVINLPQISFGNQKQLIKIFKELDLNKKPTFLESLPVDQKVDGNKTYQEALQEETSERIKRNVQLYDQKVSQNRTISPFIAELKMDISDAFYKPTKKFINEYKGGYEGFLTDFKATLLNNYTTTYLARHPLFRKGILKRVKGQWMPPRKINKNGIFKYHLYFFLKTLAIVVKLNIYS